MAVNAIRLVKEAILVRAHGITHCYKSRRKGKILARFGEGFRSGASVDESRIVAHCAFVCVGAELGRRVGQRGATKRRIGVAVGRPVRPEGRENAAV